MKRTTTLLLFLFSLLVNAQNDLCSNAATLTPALTCTATSGSFNGALLDGTVSACAPNASQDVWYRFTAGNPSLSITVTNSINIGLDLGLELYASDCTGSPIACINQGNANSGGEFYSYGSFQVGTTYYIRVFNVSQNLSTGNFSICVQGQVLGTDTNVLNAVKVTPNPVRDILKVSNWDGLDGFSYQIINLQGQIVEQNKLSQEVINTNNLSKGLYVLRLFDQTKELKIKFIKE